MRETNRKNSQLAQNKILIGVSIYSASQGQTSNLNKTNTEFFSDSVKKNSQHVLTERSLVYKFSARAGTDLELKTKVCPSFMLNFSFFASGVWEALGFICTAHRGLNRHAKRESLAQTCIAKQGQTSNLNKINTEFFSEALKKTRSTC